MLMTQCLMRIGLSLLVVLTAATQILAGEINSSAGTSSFSFLKINVGGRAVGMGGAFSGLADDESALYYNPAGLVAFEQQRFIAEYHNYFAGLQSGFAGYVHPLSENRAYGIQVSYLNYGEFTQTDQAGNVEGTFGGGDLMLAGTFALRRSREITLGVTAKFIYERIQDYSATGLAVDLGARYMTDRSRYGGGLMIQNLGAELSSLGEGEKASLPTILRAGLSARPPGLNMVLASDLIVPFDNDIEFALGAEYFKFKPLYLRMGWNSFGSNFRTDYSDNGLAGLSLGVGVDYRSLQFSYAFTPAADLGDSHRVTITGGM